MSLKRRVQFQFSSWVTTVQSLSLPSWLTCKLTRLVLIAIIIGCGTGYIVKTASTASTGYEIYSLENKVQQLENEIEKTEAQITDYSSMVSIQKRLKDTNMLTVKEIIHYSPDQKAVAKR